MDSLADQRRWRLHPVGALDLLPGPSPSGSSRRPSATSDVDGMLVNVAVPYGGRREIADAVRSLLQEHAGIGTSLEELAELIDVEHIADHLYTRGQPDPDLVIRTSGEQRLGGFLLWQSAKSEFYFCEAYWPDFRRVDFLRAIRAYTRRDRRLGACDPARAFAPPRRPSPGSGVSPGRVRSPAYVRGSGEWGSSPHREGRSCASTTTSRRAVGRRRAWEEAGTPVFGRRPGPPAE